MHSQPDDEELDSLSFSLPSSSRPSGQPLRSPAANGSSSSGIPGLSGRIGSTNQPKSTKNTTWGVKTETRYTGESTLDEPVSKTIVGGLLEVKATGVDDMIDEGSEFHLCQIIAGSISFESRK